MKSVHEIVSGIIDVPLMLVEVESLETHVTPRIRLKLDQTLSINSKQGNDNCARNCVPAIAPCPATADAKRIF